MKYFVFLVFSAVLFTGCSVQDDTTSGEDSTNAPFMTGLIYEVDNGDTKKSILVVEGTDDKFLPSEEWQGNPATVFTITNDTQIFDENDERKTFDDLKKGQKVEVWVTGEIRESYPSQANAEKIKIVSEHVGEAKLSCMVPDAEDVQGETSFTIYYTCEEKLYPVHRFISDTEVISLQVVLEELLKGPTIEEQALGLHSWFSDETEGLLNQVTIADDGTAIIDFANFSRIIPNASTSAGKKILMSQLSTAVFKHSTAINVVFQFDGSAEEFCHWMEVVCEPYSRVIWEEHTAIVE